MQLVTVTAVLEEALYDSDNKTRLFDSYAAVSVLSSGLVISFDLATDAKIHTFVNNHIIGSVLNNLRSTL